MVALKHPVKIKVGNEYLFQFNAEHVQSLFSRMSSTHDITGATRSDGREIAVALPKGEFRKGQQCWIGFTLDGVNWYGCGMRRGERATNLFRAVLQEVTK